MSEVLGKCPKCGADYITGKYGPYCSGKCGFSVGRKAYGHELSDDETKKLLGNKKILLEGLISKRTGNTYDMYIQPDGIKEYSYKNRNGDEVSGFEFAYKTSFPDNNAGKKTETKVSDNGTAAVSEDGDYDTGDDEQLDDLLSLDY